MKKFTYISLFSGIGGFDLAANNLNGQCLGYSEIEKKATPQKTPRGVG